MPLRPKLVLVGDAQPMTPHAKTATAQDLAQLGHVQKMEALGQITGGIAHELNNMLLAINLNLEALAEEIPMSAATQPMFDGAQQAIGQATDLILQLLAFSRRRELAAADFDVNRAVSETHVLLRLVLPANIEIEETPHPHGLTVFADRSQFEMALLNIALNAGEAMPRGGRLRIAISRIAAGGEHAVPPGLAAGDYALITVSDTGEGMTPEIAARAFEPFFTTRSGAGRSGLGLSQVYGYAKQSGGRAEIDCSPGGTTVRLLLPLRRAAAPIRRKEPTPHIGRGETILMVEDTPLVRHAVARMLTDLGYRVLAAAGPEEALTFLEGRSPIDLLFTDVMLPGELRGDELAVVARRLRPDIRVLYTSGYNELKPADLIDDRGCSLIAKPYSKAELARRLRTVLDG
jgi:nitrogen-specific signal transduction histidine kinase/CheY-like chemotaxis protein